MKRNLFDELKEGFSALQSAREGLYKALSENGNPEFATVMKVIKAVGLKLHVEAVHH